MADKTVSQLITDYIGKIPNPATASKFNELSNEYHKAVEHCHNTHFAQQENLNMSNRATGVKRSISIEPKLSAIENDFREKAHQLASDLGYREKEKEQQHSPQQQPEQQIANDNKERFSDNKGMTAAEQVRETKRQEFLQRRRQREEEQEKQKGKEWERD